MKDRSRFVVFRPEDIQPTHIVERSSRDLWQPETPDVDRQVIADGWRITLWYDDTFGNHYRCVYRRQANRWIEEERMRLPTRPSSVPTDDLGI